MKHLQTKIIKGAVKDILLKESIIWEEGIRSKKGFTRKAKALLMGEYPLIDEIILDALKKITKNRYLISHIYLNYYVDGNMWTPNHSHPGTHQLVISLGASRNLDIGKKSFLMESGDIILFGSSIHGVPKCDIKEGRISIATFMTPII